MILKEREVVALTLVPSFYAFLPLSAKPASALSSSGTAVLRLSKEAR